MRIHGPVIENVGRDSNTPPSPLIFSSEFIPIFNNHKNISLTSFAFPAVLILIPVIILMVQLFYYSTYPRWILDRCFSLLHRTADVIYRN